MREAGHNLTCIAGLEHGGKVYIGGDSAGVSGWSLQVRADEKVFTNGAFIFGFTTSFRMGQLLRYRLSAPEQLPSQDDYAYMVGPFIDAVRQCLKDGGYAEVHDQAESGGTFLVGYKGRLYYVGDDYQVGRLAHGYTAVGCGQDVARGALAILKDSDLAPKERVTKALEASEYHNAGVRGPFVVVAQ